MRASGSVAGGVGAGCEGGDGCEEGDDCELMVKTMAAARTIPS
jgi:hypothetical protein